jgi:DNA polymerase III psi subunit
LILALYETEVEEYLRGKNVELLTNDVRIRNVFHASSAEPCLLAFAKHPNRCKLPNWGKRSEGLFVEKLDALISSRFPQLLEPRQASETASPVPADNEPQDSQAPDSDDPLIFRSWNAVLTRAFYSKNEQGIWKRIEAAGLLAVPIGKIALILGKPWSDRHHHRPLGDYRPQPATSLLATAGLGKTKLSTLLPCVLWAAYDGKLPETINRLVSPRDALGVAKLDARSHQVLTLRFMDPPPRTLNDIGKSLNLTRERIRQIQAMAFAKISDLGLAEGMKQWLLSKDEEVFELLSEDGGITVRNPNLNRVTADERMAGIGLAMAIADTSLEQLLSRVAIASSGGRWIRAI